MDTNNLNTSSNSFALLPSSVQSGLVDVTPELSNRSSLDANLTVYYQGSDDNIILGNGNNTIYTGEGNNFISSGSGNSVVYGGVGNDNINVGDGKNTIYAGEGINLITVGASDNLIYAGAANDFIRTGNGSNTIYAGEGNNRILTGKGTGNNLIYSGAGNDVIYTGAGNDTIYAGEGNNIIDAGTGNDTVYIGSGKNKIILEAGEGSVTIIGFNAKLDKLRLGESLTGKFIKFVSKGGDTELMAGSDLLATIKYLASGSPTILDNEPLYRYVATDLGSLSSNPNGSVNAASINDFGQIAGRYDTGATFTNQNATTGATVTTNLVRQGFIWENGNQTALTSTGVKNGQSDFGAADGATVTMLTPNVNTISNRGVILGTGDEVRQPIPKPTDRALVWEKDGNTYKLTINDFGGVESYSLDTNNDNVIVGRNILSSGYEKTIYIENGVVKELAALGGDGGTARAINNLGQIVGYVDSDGIANDTFVNTAVIWEKDAAGNYQLKNLDTFGAEQVTLRDINDAGSIIGATSSGDGATATSTPFILRNGEFTALGSLGGKTGAVNGINEFGQVVGASQIASGTNHAYVWNEGVIADLNNLISSPLTYNGAAVTLNSALGVNNFGDIVATGTYSYKDAAGATQTGTRSYVLKVA